MDKTYLIIFFFIALFALWIFFSQSRAKSMQGNMAPDTSSLEGDKPSNNKVLFFHSPGCSPCKSMMPLIEKLQLEYSNLYLVEVGQHIDLARQFRLAGTPSFFAIRNGIIDQVKLGSVNEQWLRKNLDD